MQHFRSLNQHTPLPTAATAPVTHAGPSPITPLSPPCHSVPREKDHCIRDYRDDQDESKNNAAARRPHLKLLPSEELASQTDGSTSGSNASLEESIPPRTRSPHISIRSDFALNVSAELNATVAAPFGSSLAAASPLDDVWVSLNDIQNDVLGAAANEGAAPQYAVSVAHELLLRAENTSPLACFIDLMRHVAMLARMQDTLSLLVERNRDPELSRRALERVAERLLAILNEIAFTTRPLNQPRAVYIRPALAIDKPLLVFQMFAKLHACMSEQQAVRLVERLPIPLCEWVLVRNNIVVISERVRCSREILLQI